MTRSAHRLVGNALAVVVCVASLTGCATMFGRRAQGLTVTTDPPGAQLWVNGADSGVTPRTMRIKRVRAPLDLRVQVAGADAVTKAIPKIESAGARSAAFGLGLLALPGPMLGGAPAAGVVMGALLYGLSVWVDTQTGRMFVLPTDTVHLLIPARSTTRP